MDRTIPENAAIRIQQLEKRLEILDREYRKNARTNLAKYRRVIEATSEGFVELDLKFRIIDHNAKMIELSGIRREDLLHIPFEELYDNKTVHVHFASNDHLNFEAYFQSRSGKRFPVLFKRSCLRDKQGRLDGYLVFLTELTELKNAQEDLILAETRYRDIYQNAVQGMYQCTLGGTIYSINPSFSKMFGYEHPAHLLREVVNISSLYKNQNDRQDYLTTLERDRTITNYEIEMVGKDGQSIWVLASARLTKEPDGTSMIEGILIDNTQKRMAEDKLRRSRERFRYLADHDNLTGLFNTRYLYRSLEKLIIDSNERREPFSLVFLDMDNFKHVVDTYGHLNGSQALKEVAETLREGLAEHSFGVAYGGDEFVLVLPQSNKEQAIEHVGKIRKMMKDTIYLSSKQLQLRMSASFGVATYPDDAADVQELLALADKAMFHVKSSGKDAVGTSDAVE